MKITLEVIRERRACVNQAALFERLFGAEVVVTEELCVQHTLSFDWTWASQRLLSAPARRTYNEACAPAWRTYDEACASARRAYNEACASTQRAYGEACASTQRAYGEACASAERAYDEARASAQRAYDEARARAFARACA